MTHCTAQERLKVSSKELELENLPKGAIDEWLKAYRFSEQLMFLNPPDMGYIDTSGKLRQFFHTTILNDNGNAWLIEAKRTYFSSEWFNDHTVEWKERQCRKGGIPVEILLNE
jgi:hypothetical protein